MKPHNLAFALALSAVLWVLIALALTGCTTPKEIRAAQAGRGLTLDEARRAYRYRCHDMNVWPETPTLDEVC